MLHSVLRISSFFATAVLGYREPTETPGPRARVAGAGSWALAREAVLPAFPKRRALQQRLEQRCPQLQMSLQGEGRFGPKDAAQHMGATWAKRPRDRRRKGAKQVATWNMGSEVWNEWSNIDCGRVAGCSWCLCFCWATLRHAKRIAVRMCLITCNPAEDSYQPCCSIIGGWPPFAII